MTLAYPISLHCSDQIHSIVNCFQHSCSYHCVYFQHSCYYHCVYFYHSCSFYCNSSRSSDPHMSYLHLTPLRIDEVFNDALS